MLVQRFVPESNGRSPEQIEMELRARVSLYVLDGALLPGNAGACNPSMTIAAVAGRALDNLVAQDVGTAI
ncbi:hypothetical protein [Nocardia sp. CA-119907]|uniref:hypothetical protein n=1 Tax=Nocardia sp. CA-119907 TaxID=3239973 RepID=UPI003D96F0B5